MYGSSKLIPKPNRYHRLRCPDCSWQGTVAESLLGKDGHAYCPQCTARVVETQVGLVKPKG